MTAASSERVVRAMRIRIFAILGALIGAFMLVIATLIGEWRHPAELSGARSPGHSAR